jgi:hypothetical protein
MLLLLLLGCLEPTLGFRPVGRDRARGVLRVLYCVVASSTEKGRFDRGVRCK